MRAKYLFILILILGACNNKKKLNYTHDLTSTGKLQTFNLDDEVNYRFLSLFTVYEDNKHYLYFWNYNTNQILFYDFDDDKPIRKLDLEYEGPNGVGKISSMMAYGLNEIYITSFDKNGISIVDSTGHVYDFIKYQSPKEKEDFEIIPFLSYSYFYQPLIKIENKYYISQIPVLYLPVTDTPVSIAIDSLNHTAEILPFSYPDFMNNKSMDFSFADYSREFDGEKFIYSFFLDENIYVTNIEHNKKEIYPIKSRYINKINPYEKIPRSRQGDKRICERPLYHNLVYDKYRDVYYRFVFPETEVSSKLDYPKIISQGRKEFSIIILDKDFNILGETLFPPYEYVSHVFFIHPDGLYICNNHVLNENFNEDVLSFECFELVKK